MKIQILDAISKKPFSMLKVQLQIKGKDAGYYSHTTDTDGYVELDGKFNGQQLTCLLGGAPGQWVTATEGIKLYVESKKEKEKQKF